MAAQAGACLADAVNAVTIVIDYQGLGGGTQTYCVSGLAAGTTGVAALEAAGVAVQGTVHDGPSFVCRINSRPGPDETLTLPNGQSYTESCANTPPASAFWSFWTATQGGAWSYSSQGGGSRSVKFGEYEGWSFALGYGVGKAPQPRVAPAAWAVPPVPEPSTAKPSPTTSPVVKPSPSKTAVPVPATSKPVVPPPASTRPAPTTAAPTHTSPTATAPQPADTPTQTASVSPTPVPPSQNPVDASPTPGGVPASGRGGPPWGTFAVLALIVVLAAGAGGAVWYRRRKAGQ